MQYEHRPFNGDPFIRETIRRQIKRWNVRTVVETGTHIGTTAAALARVARCVHTIEIDRKRFREAAHLDRLPNVTRHVGSSPRVLDEILPRLKSPLLFYLDAHWRARWPLLAELRAIARHGVRRPLIAIHDVEVPGKPFGYDVYGGQKLCLAYVRPALEGIYGSPGFRYRYNQKAAGARRGILYVCSKRKAR